MSDIKKLAGQTVIYGIPTIIGRFLNYFLVPLYTYNIATQDYGVVSELYAYVSFLMIILTYGMETAFFRYSQDYDKRITYNTAMLSIIISTSLFLILSFSFLSPICHLLQYDNHHNYIALFVLIICFDVLKAIPYALLRRENKAKRFALIKSTDIFANILFNLFFIALCPILYKQGNSLITPWFRNDDLVFYIFLSNCLACAIAFLLLMPEIRLFQFRFDFKLLKKMLSYGFPVMIGGLAGMVNETFDRIALKHLISVPQTIAPNQALSYKMSQIGIYGACYKLSIVISLFIQAFKFAAEPFFFSKMKQQDAKQSYSSIMTVFVMFLAFIFLIVTGYIDLFGYFVGKTYREGLIIVPILLAANIFLGIYYNLSIWYKITDKTKWGAYISILGAIVTLVGNYILVPRLGYMGAAITTLICYFFIACLCYGLGQKYYKVNYDLKKIAFYVFLSIILFALNTIVRISTNSLLIKLSMSSIALIIYLIFAYKLDLKTLFKKR